ncbi:hypothetical protein ACH5RR_005621 [Cinchona calisaya]|uniref:Carbonic anhydrase n=1 Tax=Cinchona calisaya TaxID=153742 RepID=A0ABD3ALM8_9GENT
MPAHFAIFFIVATTFLIINASPMLAEEGSSVGTQISYSGDTGPDKWGSLNPAFSACSNGKSQSPVDIVSDKVVLNKNLKPLARQYNSTNSTLVNNGFNIELRRGENSGRLVSDGKIYKFTQMHWHSPSEHRINGVQYEGELHLVHIADDGSIAVVGILYHIRHPDPLIAKIKSKLSELADQSSEFHGRGQVAVGKFSMKQLQKNTRKYYRYSGSLTTPPCSETVVWHILGKVSRVGKSPPMTLQCGVRGFSPWIIQNQEHVS